MKEIEILTLIVSVLSILVMILIGWQIFNVLTFEKRIARIKRKLMKYTEEMAGESSLVVMSMNLTQSAFNFSVMGKHDDALKSAVDALNCLLGLKVIYRKHPGQQESSAGKVVENIKGLTERPGALFSKETVDKSIELLSSFNSRSAYRAISILKEAPIKE